jgi:hypothetical protein
MDGSIIGQMKQNFSAATGKKRGKNQRFPPGGWIRGAYTGGRVPNVSQAT